MSQTMNFASQTYAEAARITMSPRELEASALIKSAARLQVTADNPSSTLAAYDAALTHNRRLWTVIAASISDPTSHLPDDLKGRLLTIANFVFNHTLAISSAPTAENVAALIRINRELAAGLRHPV